MTDTIVKPAVEVAADVAPVHNPYTGEVIPFDADTSTDRPTRVVDALCECRGIS